MPDSIRIIGKLGEREKDEPTPSDVSAKVIKSLYPLSERLMTTDFLVLSDTRSALFSSDGRLAGFLCDEGVISIDHHVPDEPLVQRHISSTNMAIAYVETFGPWGTESPVMGTHKDADSILSAGILAGLLEPIQIFGEAAIEADHRGGENSIADLLQSLRDRGDETDITDSLACLITLLTQGERYLPDYAKQALLTRRRQRAQLQRLVETGAFAHVENGVYYAELPERINGELLPALLSKASVIVVAYPLAEGKKTEEQRRNRTPVFEVKTRTGTMFPEGRSLQEFDLPHWGGRWNAGSTGRQGGTADPKAFASLVAERLTR